jgi:uncharacterized protein (TIGR02594 family)
MIGKSEQPNRAELADYLRTGGQSLDPATTAWCAAFVNASLAKSGRQGTGQMNARSFMDWGQPVDQPQPGDVAVFSRGDPNGWRGHVGFYQNVPMPAPDLGLDSLFAPAPRPRVVQQDDRAAAEKQRRAALFDAVPGLG